MPGSDKTGPEGKGPINGKRMGVCTEPDQADWNNCCRNKIRNNKLII